MKGGGEGNEGEWEDVTKGERVKERRGGRTSPNVTEWEKLIDFFAEHFECQSEHFFSHAKECQLLHMKDYV